LEADSGGIDEFFDTPSKTAILGGFGGDFESLELVETKRIGVG